MNFPYEHFLVSVADQVATVSFNRPAKSNSLNEQTWDEMKAVFEQLDGEPEVRAIILAGEGKNFCAGIDLAMLANFSKNADIDCPARKREALMKEIAYLQSTITAIELCRKPVLAAIHRACIGGGVDVTTACDIRYCTEDAYFSIKEVDMGLVADVGTLQRLPKIITSGLTAELAFTGRNMDAKEAVSCGLVTRAYADKATMMEEVTKLAKMIAKKSPIVIRGTKQMIRYTRDHSVPESLQQMSVWNAAYLESKDLQEAVMSFMEKREASFDD